MSTEPLFSLKNPWFTASVGLTASIALLSAFIGLVWLPYAGPDSQLLGLWDAICSAAGVPSATESRDPVKPAFTTSNVVMTSQMLSKPSERSVGRGATLAMQCAICHGANRRSQVDTPNLEGQPAAAVYKQLQDFKATARTNAVMSPFTINRPEQDFLDLAAYYASLPLQPGFHPDASVVAPQIVVSGAPMRNIPPCSSCHGSLDTKSGSPLLEGQSAVYIKAQLQAFAAGTRHNDISEQMRNIARHMTVAEMDEAARYYASRP